MSEEFRDFWSTANAAFTDEERRAFNLWRRSLWMSTEDLRDDTRLTGGTLHYKTGQKARALHRMITEIPVLLGE
jgi:hypothetical protein